MRTLKNLLRAWLLPELPELMKMLELQKRLALERALRAQVASAKNARVKPTAAE